MLYFAILLSVCTGSYDPRQGSDKPASEHRSYSGTDGRRLQMSKSRVNTVEDGGGRYTQPVEVCGSYVG